MTRRQNGKAALITAGQGIGRATALRIASEDATVSAADINAYGLDTLRVENPAILTHCLDVRNSEAIQTAANEFTRIDVLFNCAGSVHQGSIIECSERDWSLSFDLTVISMYHAIRAYLPRMLESEKGSMVARVRTPKALLRVCSRSSFSISRETDRIYLWNRKACLIAAS
jgi:2-keto-3-deoxy-L-fuconate dehydrogenase